MDNRITHIYSKLGAIAVGTVSSRSRGGKADRLREGVRVHDVFELKASYHLDHPPGVVVVLDAFPYRYPRRFVGKVVKIISGPGEGVRATIDEAKSHHATISFFFKGLSKQDISVGSTVFLED
ncbi:MAG: hypothetical protein ABI353_18255 [Isosphaeraceae bacterium]